MLIGFFGYTNPVMDYNIQGNEVFLKVFIIVCLILFTVSVIVAERISRL